MKNRRQLLLQIFKFAAILTSSRSVRALDSLSVDQADLDQSLLAERNYLRKILESELNAKNGIAVAYKDPCKEAYSKKEYLDKMDAC